jgi:hypothetical protein
MPTNPLVGALTPKIRQGIYLTLFGLGVLYGVLRIVYDPDPEWLNKAGEVLVYLSALGGGALASSNIAVSDPQQKPDKPVGAP